MCGIVGYLINREASEVLVEGTSKLEYRGYDSADVSVNTGEELSIKKFKDIFLYDSLLGVIKY